MRTRVKICGITNETDARAAVEFGADALGVIGVRESPRFVAAEDARPIFAVAGPFVPVVTVVRRFEDSLDYPDGIAQFYDGRLRERRPGIRVFRIKDESSLTALADYREPVAAILLDTFHDGALGGVGRTFDWSLAVAAKKRARGVPIILAGGLTPENVGAAIEMVRPYAVDVSSGVEAEPGRKDHDTMRRFIEAVRDAA